MDRRKDSLFWKIIERSTNLVFLLLAIVILSKQWGDEKAYSQILAEKKVILDIVDNRTFYLEGKTNKVAEVADDHFNSLSTRVEIVEESIRKLQKENRELKLRDKTIITNNNTATAIVNGRSTDQQNNKNNKQ